jgi:hypothetical protein
MVPFDNIKPEVQLRAYIIFYHFCTSKSEVALRFPGQAESRNRGYAFLIPNLKLRSVLFGMLKRESQLRAYNLLPIGASDKHLFILEYKFPPVHYLYPIAADLFF